jgi:hypothetical protein
MEHRMGMMRKRNRKGKEHRKKLDEKEGEN